MKLTNGKIAILVIFLVLFIDQFTKIWVKTHMYLGQDIEITKWFYILFIENNGMAFGIEIISKLFLSLFRIAAVIFIGYYLYKIVHRPFKRGKNICIALILAGAFGNYMNPESAAAIGMFPAGLLPRIQPEGNAAGEGAISAAISKEAREQAKKIREHMYYIELSMHPEFSDAYMDLMYFE